MYTPSTTTLSPASQAIRDDLTALQSSRRAPLPLSSLSPVLAAMEPSCLVMPGVNRDGVFVSSFSPTFQVLATKTRPKKFFLLGSNGKRYFYLLKGREDLHLDERIMQFLVTANRILRGDRESKPGMEARNYAVIPLSEQSGLIQWVNGTTSLYSIYKHWQKRNHNAAQAAAAAANKVRTGSVGCC